MCINELGRLMVDSLGRFINLEVNRTVFRVCIVLMPSKKKISVGVNPIPPVEFMLCRGLHLKSNLDSCCLYWIGVVLKEMPWVHLGAHSIWTRFTRVRYPELDSLESNIRLKPICDTTMKPFILDAAPIGEKDDH
jgi:hypothetical protein